MIVTAETRVLDAHRTLAVAQRRIRELHEEEHQAISRRDYANATTAAQLRQMYQESYDLACAVIVRGGRQK